MLKLIIPKDFKSLKYKTQLM